MLHLTQGEYELQKQKMKEAEAAMFPDDKMWGRPDDDRMIEVYPGTRNFRSVAYAVVIPLIALGFFLFGISTGLEKPLVDYLPIDREWTEFLRPPSYIMWDFQGMAMTATGAIGLITLAPKQIYTVFFNPGYGRLEIDRKKRLVRIVLDGHCRACHLFEEVKNVHLFWDNAADIKMVGESPQTMSLELKNGDEVPLFPDVGYCGDKRIMEKRAAELAEFMDVELMVTDV